MSNRGLYPTIAVLSQHERFRSTRKKEAITENRGNFPVTTGHLQDCIALRAYEMPLEVLANEVNAFVLSTDPHMEEAKDCLHSPLERLLKQLTACKRYEGEDFLVEKEFSKRD
ncbi:hypothetical protein JHK82_035001 [Glycine max]|nr:hypothetical protein JHK85_035716 [Glycine max]KAG5111732.1 hypothetical protein JHK82_035001 [Glycine max]